MLSPPTRAAGLAISKADEWFRPGRFAAILILLIIAAFPDVVFGWRTFFYRDFGIFGYPLAFHHRESFWSGEIPLWNPLNNCGLPFLAQWNTMVLYPLSLIYILFPLSWSLGVFCLLHLLLAGLGMYRLAHEWTHSRLAASVAGLAFAFNGLTLSCLKWPNNIAALAWMPFVVWLAERGGRLGGRRLVLAALVGALQMLTGGPEIILLTWAFVAALWLVILLREPLERRVRIIRLCTMVVLVAGLASAQLFPFMDLLGHSQRDAAYRDASWAMPWWGLANFLVPLFRCFPSHQGVFAQLGQYWVSSYYVSIGVLALAALAALLRRRETPLEATARVWILIVISGTSLVLALGESGMVYEWLRQLFPALQIVRFPVKFVVLVVFALPLLCAIGLARLQDRFGAGAPEERAEQSASASIPAGSDGVLLVLGVVFVGLIAVVLWVAWKYPLPTDQWSATWRSGVGRGAFLALTLAATWAVGRFTLPRAQVILGCGFLLLIWSDTMTHAPQLNPTVERWVYEPGLARRELKLNPEPKIGESRVMLSPFADFRLNHLALTNAVDDYLYSRMSLFANANLLDQIPKVDGFFSLYMIEEVQARSLLYGSTNTAAPRWASFLGVSQRTAEGKLIEWTPQPGNLALATGGQKPIFADGPGTLRAIADAAFDPNRFVYLPVEAQSGASVSNASTAKVTMRQFSSHQVELDVEATLPAWVVIAQSYYHPWQTSVNGKAAPLRRANHFAQALEVPAGRSTVRLVYKDRTFQAGVLVSILALCFCLGFWFRADPGSKPEAFTIGSLEKRRGAQPD